MKTGIIAAFVLLLAVPASAQEPRVRSSSRTLTGVLLIAAGAGAVAGAFNYRRDCAGYRSTYRQDWFTEYDYCTTINDRHVHVEETPWDISLARPGLLWGGVGTIAVGTLLSTIWSDVPVARDLDVQVSPGRLAVGRTFGF